jgi:hypothetical protein
MEFLPEKSSTAQALKQQINRGERAKFSYVYRITCSGKGASQNFQGSLFLKACG